jgi:diaminopimelate decarboxylase
MARVPLVALLAACAPLCTSAFGGASALAGRARGARTVVRAAVGPGIAATSASAPRFLSAEQARSIRDAFGTPCYVYDSAALVAQAKLALAFPAAYGLTVRFAMKACPSRAVLELFRSLGVCIDASSGYEVTRAMAAGYAPSQISLSSQEMPDNIGELVRMGVQVNACSIAQLDKLGCAAPGSSVGVRFNPGVGSGGTGKTNVGGPSSSFGIWFEQLEEVQAVLAKHALTPVRVHTHIGSGSDPLVWERVATLTLDLAASLGATIETVNLGGGFKVGRMPGEASTDLSVVGVSVKAAFQAYAAKHGRELRLEIEPGTFLVANAGALLAAVQDRTSTKGHGSSGEGHEFVKLDAGMTEVLRPSLYGAQHPISILPGAHGRAAGAVGGFIVSGHCCESGDLFTCKPGEPEALLERPLHTPQIGDLCVIDGAGAYCAGARAPGQTLSRPRPRPRLRAPRRRSRRARDRTSASAGMSTKNYNSFPEAAEVLIGLDGQAHLVRKRQTLDQILANELALPHAVAAAAAH